MKKSILITGCSSGIGLESVRVLAERGYTVIASARSENDVENLLRGGYDAIQLDVASPKSIDVALEAVLGKTGGTLYALFNNAGFGIPGAVEDLTRDALRVQFETNVFGAFELIQKVMPTMRRQGNGRIIQNSSVLGFVALPFRGAYIGSKFALEGLTDAMRLEIAGTNIFISLIEPGPIATKFRENSLKALHRYIDVENTVYRELYQQTISRLSREGAGVPFTLPSSAVVAKLIHALESRRPKPRYYVTFPTYLFGYLKRILPTSVLDRILRGIL